VLVLFVLAIDGFNVTSAAGVPRQKPDAVALTERFIVNLPQITTILQIKRVNVVTTLAQRLDQRRSNQPVSTQDQFSHLGYLFQSPHALGNLNLLCVAQSPVVRVVIRHTFRRCGFSVMRLNSFGARSRMRQV